MSHKLCYYYMPPSILIVAELTVSGLFSLGNLQVSSCGRLSVFRAAETPDFPGAAGQGDEGHQASLKPAAPGEC